MVDNSMIDDYALERLERLKQLSLLTEKPMEVESEEEYVALYREMCNLKYSSGLRSIPKPTTGSESS